MIRDCDDPNCPYKDLLHVHARSEKFEVYENEQEAFWRRLKANYEWECFFPIDFWDNNT